MAKNIRSGIPNMFSTQAVLHLWRVRPQGRQGNRITNASVRFELQQLWPNPVAKRRRFL